MAVRYHVWWPGAGDPYYVFNTAENRARTNYYGVGGVPTLKIDGFIDGGGNGQYWGRIVNRHHMDSPLVITLGGTYDDSSRAGTLNVRIIAIDDADWNSLYVRIALTESRLYWHAPNGANYHHQTMRDMIPTAVGQSLNISYGDTVDITQNFMCPTQVNYENAELVVWVQNDQYREIYQAAHIWLSDMEAVGIEDSPEVPRAFDLVQNYPNPFNAGTTIEFALTKPGVVELGIYDIVGRKVATLVDGTMPAGAHQIVWDGIDDSGNPVSSGVYFYRLESGGENLTMRMVLLK